MTLLRRFSASFHQNRGSESARPIALALFWVTNGEGSTLNRETAASNAAQAREALADNRLATALIHIREARRLDPQHWDYPHTEAAILWALDERGPGFVASAEAARLAPPDNGVPEMRIATWHAQIGNNDRAIEHLERALTKQPSLVAKIERDDFAPLRASPEFWRILQRAARQYAPTTQDERSE